MVDVFEEVEEQLRSDRYRSLARTWGPLLVAALALTLAAALGYWGYDTWRRHGAQEASTAYAAGIDSLQKGDAKGADANFAKVASGSSAVYRTLALMQQAGAKVTAGDNKAAVALFDQAALTAPDKVLGDAAKLKAAYLLFDTASEADIEARLTPLADKDRPYRALAREGLAMAKLRAGKLAAAKADFKVIATMLDAPADMQKRADAAIALIDGGTASAIPAELKTAAAQPANAALAAALAQAQAQAQQPQEAGAAQ